MLKHYRQEQILKLIRSEPIHTQEELADKLRRMGIRATQVTLSRDLHELGLAKTAEGYRELAPRSVGGNAGGAAAAPAAREVRHLKRIAGNVLRDVRQAQNILVLRTDPGNAQPLAIALDQENWPEIVGTIAGDDTIMIVSHNRRAATALRTKLLALIGK